ncbi:MAG TPA: alpha/beta hydrolase [Oculatellaceae cyanobacterium]
MSIFVLVHGAFLGRFCWDLLVPELHNLGHQTVAFDLPIEVPELGAEAYAEFTLKEIERQLSGVLSSPPVLVGHSMGGLVIPLVAQEIEVSGCVYLAAALPKPGASFMERARSVESDVFLTEGDVNPYLQRDLADRYWFHDCSKEVAAWAREKIRPHNSARIIFEQSPIKKLPEVPACSIVGAQERLLSPVWSRRMSQELLGVQSIDVEAGHCPQISQAKKVAEILHDFASAPAPSDKSSSGSQTAKTRH